MSKPSNLGPLVLGLSLFLATGCGSKKKVPASDAGVTAASVTSDGGTHPKNLGTTSPAIALGNFNGDVEQALAQKSERPAQRARLVDLLLSRAHYYSKISDLQLADELSKQFAEAASADGDVRYARASVHAALHRFDAATKELDAAAAAGASSTRIARSRASILLALGKYDEALALQPPDLATKDTTTIATAAVLAAKMQKPDESERLFELARERFSDVSPFPVAWMDFQRGTVLELAGKDASARTWFTEAVEVLPPYAHAVIHLAAAEPPEAAIARLEAVRKTSDDPDVLAALAAAHTRASHADEAKKLLVEARARYTEIIAKMPEAFADHAARFWLGPGGDAPKALDLARANVKVRSTEEAVDLWITAAVAAAKTDDVCASASAMTKLRYASPRNRALATTMSAKCPDAGSP